jgi:hypothetical protein
LRWCSSYNFCLVYVQVHARCLCTSPCPLGCTDFQNLDLFISRLKGQ